MKKLLNQKGQSTIELLVTLVFVFGFVFLFLKTALNTTSHFMAHYYTFLASRSYMVLDNNGPPGLTDTVAVQKTEELFAGFPLSALGIEGELGFNTPSGPEYALLTGVHFRFESMMTLGKALGGEKKLNLTSESFLLREPPRSDCLNQICNTIKSLGGDCTTHATLADNGC